MRIYLLAALTLFFACVTFAQTPAASLPAPGMREWKIGFIAPLSGSASNYGQSAKNGFTMGMEESRNPRVKVIEEDDQFQPAKSAIIFQKLADADKIDLAVTFGSSPSHAIVPLAENRNIPVLAFATDRKLSVDRKFVLRTTYDADKIGAAIAHEAYRLKYTDIGTIYSENDYSIVVERAFTSFLPSTSIKASEEIPPDSTDLKSSLMKMKEKKVKELFICALTGQPGLIARQLKDLSIPMTIFGCNALTVPEELKIAGGALQGAWTYGAAIDPAFAERARQRFDPSIDLYSAAVYHDIAVRLSDVLQSASDRSDVINQLLKQGRRSGALKGSEFKLDNKDQFLDIDLEKYVIGSGIY